MDGAQRQLWHPKIERLHRYWRKMQPSVDRLPGRQHFDPLDISDLMPWVWIVDIERTSGEIAFRYRLLGTEHVRAMTRDLTGRRLDEAHPEFLRHAAYPHYLQVAEGRMSWRRGRPGFHVDPDLFEMERIMLPLARDGSRPDMLLARTVYFRPGGIEWR